MRRSDWKKTTVGSLGRIVTGKTPTSAKPELFGGDYPFITPSDLDFDRPYVTTERFLSAEGRDWQKNQILPKGSVCFTCIGATIGKLCKTARPSFSNQQINTVIVDETDHDAWFVYYLLRFHGKDITSIASGAATPIVNKTTFAGFDISVPPLPIQRKIAAILSAYDDLIENNTRRITILEEMAQAIYREWFVNFRFPGHENVKLVDSSLGKIPEGWEVKKLKDVADLKWGDTNTTKKSYIESGYDAYSAAGMDGKLDHYDFDKEGVVVSAIGANCGRTWMAYGKWSCIKNTIRFWSTSDRATTVFLYLATYGTDFWPKRGAAQPFISQTDAHNKLVCTPTVELSDRFHHFADAALRQVDTLDRKNRNLRTTRDLLLPKLISGQLDVEDLDIDVGMTAEELTEAAAG